MTDSDILIVEAQYLLTRPGELLENSAIVIEGNKIIAVGVSKDLKEQLPGAKLMSFPDGLVMPGLVNGHQHGRGLSQIQLGYQDDFLEPWISGRRARGLLDGHAVTKLVAARMLANGVTATIHANYTYGTGNYEKELRDQIEAYRSVGIRVTMCVGAMDQGQLAYPPHEACFMAGLSRKLQSWLSKPGVTAYCKDGPSTIELMARLCADYESESLVQMCYGPAGPQWVSDESWKLLANDAHEKGLGLHTHALESPAQRDAAKELYPGGVFKHLEKLGAMTKRTVIAHGVWVDDQEMEVLARTGTTLIRNPGCNIRMRNGIAPLARYLQNGVRVAIGTDNCSMQDDEDLLSELRLAGNLGREPDWNGPPPPTTQQLIAMATINGAVAAQFGDEIGLLEPGRHADVVAFSLDRTRQPYLDPDMPLMEAFLSRGVGRDAQMTMVDGQVLYLNGQFTNATLADLETEAAEAALNARRPADLESMELTRELRNSLCNHYQKVALVDADQ